MKHIRSNSHPRTPSVQIVCAALFAVITLPVGALSAEVIQLKSGAFLEGRIVSQNQQRIVLRTTGGDRVISKKAVRRIVYDASMGRRLIAEEKRKRQAKIDAERARIEAARQKKLAEESARKAAEDAAAKKAAEEREAADLAAQKQAAIAARAAYARDVQEYERRLALLREKERREEELRKAQELAEAEQAVEEKRSQLNEQKEQASGRVDRWGALWRSALLPGWGQFYADSPISGSLYAGLFTLGAVNSYNLRNIALSSRNEYTSFTDTTFLLPLLPNAGIPAATVIFFETSQRSQTYQRNVKRQQQSVQLLGGIYLTQLIHAAFLSKSLDTTSFLYEGVGDDRNGGLQLIVEEVPLNDRDRILGAGDAGLDARFGMGYQLRF